MNAPHRFEMSSESRSADTHELSQDEELAYYRGLVETLRQSAEEAIQIQKDVEAVNQHIDTWTWPGDTMPFSEWPRHHL